MRLDGKLQLLPKSVGSTELDDGLDFAKIQEGIFTVDGASAITRVDGVVTSTRTTLPNGDARITAFGRDANGAVSTISISFVISPVTRAYVLDRDTDGNVTAIRQV